MVRGNSRIRMGLDGVSGGIGIYMVDTIGRLHRRGVVGFCLAESGDGIGVCMAVCICTADV